MMRMTVLASGSKGNSTVIASRGTRVLVDAGLSCRELLRRMAVVGEDPASLDAILITHEHVDHVAGLAVLARRLKIPVFFTEPTHRAWVRMLTPKTTMSYAKWLELETERRARVQAEKDARAAAEAFAGVIEAICAEEGLRSDDPHAGLELPVEVEDGAGEELPVAVKADPAFLPAVEYFQAGRGFSIGDIAVTPFTVPHDAADPCGFVFEAEGVRMAMATDLGYMPGNVKQALGGVDVLLLESNHDLEMLRDGPYPWSVKQRVLSRVGHLSNAATAEFLAREYDGGAAYIVLGHLSESNNAPELARLAAEQAIGDRMSLLGNRILLAQQSAPMEAIVL
jgi:phosphoribosyl 1,2-cyclic phosphodiesterase